MNKSSPESPAKEQPGEVAAMVKRLREHRNWETASLLMHEAAALIEKLWQGWIPVSKRLPEDEVDVLANTADGRDICFVLRGEWVYGSSPGTRAKVSHWMPLPPPPERP